MDWINQAIIEFGRDMGLSTLSLDEDYRLSLAMGDRDLLDIRYVAMRPAGEVLVSCARSLAWNRPDILRRALRLVDFRIASDWPVQVALDEQLLLFNLRIPERSFVHNVLQQAVTQLRGMHDRLD